MEKTKYFLLWRGVLEIAPSMARNAKPRASADQTVECLGRLLHKTLTYVKVRVLASPE